MSANFFGGANVTIHDGDAWQAAEYRYTAIKTALMFPFPGLARSTGEIIEELEEIVRECPEFYPAILEVGHNRDVGVTHALSQRMVSNAADH